MTTKDLKTTNDQIKVDMKLMSACTLAYALNHWDNFATETGLGDTAPYYRILAEYMATAAVLHIDGKDERFFTQ